jgi:hypothetical protein
MPLGEFCGACVLYIPDTKHLKQQSRAELYLKAIGNVQKERACRVAARRACGRRALAAWSAPWGISLKSKQAPHHAGLVENANR